MKQVTKYWKIVSKVLEEQADKSPTIQRLLDYFEEIFDLKDVENYKEMAALSEVITPKEYNYTSTVMRRAFIEGYLLHREIRCKGLIDKELFDNER